MRQRIFRKIAISFILPFVWPAIVQAGQGIVLTIGEAYTLARQHYPLSRQRELLKRSMDYSLENAAKGYLPQLSFAGQATLQSDVTSLNFKIPIAGFSFPQYSKDQYKIYGEIDQTLYDGGLIRQQRQTERVNEQIGEKNLDIELYSLYDRVNQLFFGILLIDKQLEQNDLLRKDIQNGIDKARALVSNGLAYQSSVDELEARLLQAGQARIEEQSTRDAWLDMLGLFIDRTLDGTTKLETPADPLLSEAINRPELLYYEYQKRSYDLQDQLLKVQLRPRLGVFLQGGYGRPGLNMLSNDFAFYYIGGLRLNWNFGSLYTYKNQRQLSQLGRSGLDIQKETFVFNTHITQRQYSAEISKLLELTWSDDRIILLRTSVKDAASAQLDNGVLSAHDYLTQVNAEDQARQDQILHRVQLLQAEYNYKNLTGNP